MQDSTDALLVQQREQAETKLAECFERLGRKRGLLEAARYLRLSREKAAADLLLDFVNLRPGVARGMS